MSLIIVSNRLPITVESSKGKLIIKESMGGLVTGLKSHLSTQKDGSYKWFGWPGMKVSEKNLAGFLEDAKRSNLYPLMIPDELMNQFYLGFCNRTIWPLFHYFPSLTYYNQSNWEIYREVNNIFCEGISGQIQEGDKVWIHDYHLMLLPGMLREKFRDISIGFFLHIPFPNYEIYRLLPPTWRKEILEGLLGSDLIGFHTFDYAKYFLHSVQLILGHDNNIGEILLSDRIVKADSFPMGIDYDGFVSALSTKEAQEEMLKIQEQFPDKKIILSIDRLDYSKGILNRLRGYQRFLEKYPEWRNKVVLLMIVMPSRAELETYGGMKRQINEMVGSINSVFGDLHWAPILYQYRTISQNRLCGLYYSSDSALVTPLRDGMNLIAKEYIACNTDLKGVLILSEMAGAVKELGEAIIINPNHSEEIADALNESLVMPEEEKSRRNLVMRNRLKRYNVNTWARYFMQSLDKVKTDQNMFQSKLLDEDDLTMLTEEHKNAKKSIFLLDYDGTLVPFESLPEKAKPTHDLINILNGIVSNPKNRVVIISGRDRKSLDRWFNDMDVTLISEHGAWYKLKDEWLSHKDFDIKWKDIIRPYMDIYTDLLPGTFIEEKSYSLVWHYRKADPDQASQKAKELTDVLGNITSKLDLQVLQGSKIVEVKNTGINKGLISSFLLSEDKYDFVFAAGDDWTDEDMFRALPSSAYSVKIGIASSYARFNLNDYNELKTLLMNLSNA